jgi:hypothetical protein
MTKFKSFLASPILTAFFAVCCLGSIIGLLVLAGSYAHSAPKRATSLLADGLVVLTLKDYCPPGYRKLDGLDMYYLRVGHPGERGGAVRHSHRSVVDISHSAQIGGALTPFKWSLDISCPRLTLCDENWKREANVESSLNEPLYLGVTLCETLP